MTDRVSDQGKDQDMIRRNEHINTLYLSSLWSDLSCAAELVIAELQLVMILVFMIMIGHDGSQSSVKRLSGRRLKLILSFLGATLNLNKQDVIHPSHNN